jgi:UV DNA damage endonuclease
MKIGYPAMNLGLGCKSSHTFRLASLTPERFEETARRNLTCVKRVIGWNIEQRLLFFRIGSGLIPFASHKEFSIDWVSLFKTELHEIGELIKNNAMRISMHPGHFVVLNSPSDAVFNNSVAELQYHSDLLDAMGLDKSHKVQLHLGGLHGEPEESIKVFINRYEQLPMQIKQRLVIENDERVASLQDCLRIHEACGIPILFDTLHHQIKRHDETVLKGLDLAMKTWDTKDGIPMVDYSTQDPDKKPGAHTQTLDVDNFRSFIKSLRKRDIDIMLEIKNKEASALQARLVLDNLM